MSKKLLVLTGSARPNTVSDALLPYFEQAVAAHEGTTLEVVKVADLNLPFYNAPTPPSAEGYEATDANVKSWSEKVQAADAVMWLMPEYNHGITGIQKNAIDWLYAEWKDKPLGIVAYGFYEGKYVLESIQNVIDVVSPDLRHKVGLGLMKHLNPDGSAIEEDEVVSRINATVAAVLS